MVIELLERGRDCAVCMNQEVALVVQNEVVSSSGECSSEGLGDDKAAGSVGRHEGAATLDAHGGSVGHRGSNRPLT